jgi:transcription initiation factor TFIIH subunit 1
LFCSKEGAAQVRLKLGLVNDEAGHNFTFTSPSAVAYVEREAFKQELTNIISRNRSAAPTPLQKPTPLAAISTPAKTPAPIPSTSRATSVSSDTRTPILSGIDAATDFRLRKKVLLSNPELLALHKELVMSGHITESEFWDGREVSYLASYTPFLP